jgi:nucleotide-binding universal stress UspA family protein
MYERILVPLDGSELAEGALPYAEGIATRLGSEVILLTVSAPGDCLERPLGAYLEKKAGELLSSGVAASPLVVEGDAASEILNLAEQNHVGLIIISTHGRSGISRWALGNIANKVLRASHIPTLLIKSSGSETVSAGKALGSILVPLDGSQFAEAIIPYVEGLAQVMDSEVTLLRVIEPVRLPHLAGYGQWVDWEKYEKDLLAEAEKEANRYLDSQERALRDKGVKVSAISLLGKPAETILQYADDNSCSLIALSTHGFSGMTKWAYGSVASRIIEGSSEPVLLVRPSLPSFDA